MISYRVIGHEIKLGRSILKERYPLLHMLGKHYLWWCYELKSLELDKRTNSYIRVNTRELNRDTFTN